VIEVLAFPSLRVLEVAGPLGFRVGHDLVAGSAGAPPYSLRVVTQGGLGVTASVPGLAAGPLSPIEAALGWWWPVVGRSRGGR
jgi:hypothetical protein